VSGIVEDDKEVREILLIACFADAQGQVSSPMDTGRSARRVSLEGASKKVDSLGGWYP